MKMERSEESSKKRKGNEVKLVNPNILMFSCVSGIEDGNIPEWLLMEVLLRLPVKSVFRFKLVSRMWLSIISDPYFVRVYVSRASSLSQQAWTIVPFFICQKNSPFSHLDYEMLKDLYVKPSLCVVSVPSIHGSQVVEKYLICGVSNGLVLYCWLYPPSPYDSHYYICNPLTGHCIALPPLACGMKWRVWGFHTHVQDGFLKSYRVVQFEPPVSRINRPKFQVYASEIGEWKLYTVPCNLSPLRMCMTPAVVLNGILHWIAEGHGTIAYDPHHNPEEKGIIAYDPYQNLESMRYIALPNDVGRPKGHGCLCVEYRGKLRYFEVAFSSLKVWVLDDYSSGNWCLHHNTIIRVNVGYAANFRNSIVPLCSHPFDSDIVYLGCDSRCISYNIKTREVQVEDEFFRHSDKFSKKMPSWWIYMILFVIPHWPTPIPHPSHGAMG